MYVFLGETGVLYFYSNVVQNNANDFYLTY